MLNGVNETGRYPLELREKLSDLVRCLQDHS